MSIASECESRQFDVDPRYTFEKYRRNEMSIAIPRDTAELRLTVTYVS
jgi:hypothetical protein